MSQKAIILQQLNQPQVHVTRPIPTPGPNELLVKVHVAGVNRHDYESATHGLFVSGLLPPQSTAGVVLASDVVGEVISLGPGVTNFTIGQRVMSQSNYSSSPDKGGLQEYCLLEEPYTCLVPDSISDDDAATLPINAFAPFASLFSPEGLNLPAPNTTEAAEFPYSTSTLLIIGGGANTGKYATQLAKYIGFGRIVVVANASNPSVVSNLKSLGATDLVNRNGSDAEVVSRIRQIVGDDLIFALDMASPYESYNVGLSALSNTKHGMLIWLTGGSEVPTSQYPDKQAGFTGRQINAISPWISNDIGRLFWKTLPSLLEGGHISPIKGSWAQTLKGLDVGVVDKALEAFGQGKPARLLVLPSA